MAEVDIIDLWNKGKRTAYSQEVDLKELVTKKSKTPLYWIKFILWIEFFINLISLPIVLIYYTDDHPILYGIFFPIVVVIYLVYYQFLIQKINRFDYSMDVRTGLKKLYGYLNFFFLHYKVIIWISVIPSFFYGGYLGMTESGNQPTTKIVLVFIAIGIVACGLLIIFFNFLINMIYGRKIKRLKGIVKEMEEAETSEPA